MPIIHVDSNKKKLLDEIETHLNKARRIVAITGAGISTNCGIPDFRSKEGLYNLINSDYRSSTASKTVNTGALKGKDLFSSTVWHDQDSTSVFYSFIASLRKTINEDVKATSQTHKFLRRIRDQKKLLRCYTQNIDGLESRDGLCVEMNRGKGSRSRFTKKSMDLPNYEHNKTSFGKMDGGCEVVQLHGDLQSVRCTICQRNKEWSRTEQAQFIRGQAPTCLECEEEDVVRKAAGKRGSAVGTLRPNIVLYGEGNPMENEIGSLISHDLTFAPDLLLIMGTSLQVHGLKTIVKEFAKAVHSRNTGKVLFINLSEPAQSAWKDVIDYWVEMDCDEWSKDKMKVKQTELSFSTIKSSTKSTKDKENISSVATPKGFGDRPRALPTPPSSKRKRALGELDPVSATRGAVVKKANTSFTSNGFVTLPSKRRKTSSEFEIWEAEDDAIVVERRSGAFIEDSPSKGRKRRIL